MQWLAVIYDDHCGLCSTFRAWLSQQRTFVPLRLVPLHSPGLAQRFPGIAAFAPDEKLVAISDTGQVWRGEHAWIMVLWALQEGREYAQWLATPALCPFASRVVQAISRNRLQLSRWLHLTPDLVTSLPDCSGTACRTMR